MKALAFTLFLATSLHAQARVQTLLGRMTLEDKFWQLYMFPGALDDSSNDYSHGVFGLQIAAADSSARGHAERINAIQLFFVNRTRLGIPIIPFDEAVHGLMRPGATVFPAAIALAASWDTALVDRVATAIARETRSRGVREVLSPVVNIATDVRWGRVEETYGEDPFLTSELTRVFVDAFERRGVITTPKHFVANVGEGGRDSYPIELDARTLAETHFPPFEAAIKEGHARSIMSAYNSVNGVPATQNRDLLTTQLKRTWGFPGFVISDAAATGGPTVLQHTEASTVTAARDALLAGLDVIFQTSYEQHRPYFQAFQRGMIPMAVIDSAVARVLRAKFELGLFEHPYVDADSAAYWNGNSAHRALALEAEREAIVLLKNDGDVLPLARTVPSVAVIGSDAVEARLGGYSAPGNHPVSILDGLRSALPPPGARIDYVAGPGRLSPQYTVIPAAQFGSGLNAEYFDNPRLEGSPVVKRSDARVDFSWTLNSPAHGLLFDWYSARWTGRLSVPANVPDSTRIGVAGNDGYRLYIDGQLALDNWQKRSYGVRFARLTLTPARSYDVRLEYFESTGPGHVQLVWDAGAPRDWQASIDSAVALARRSRIAVVVAGVEEGEFRDRSTLALPGHQEELIAAVAETGTPVVVVLVGGSAITMNHWLDRVAAVIDVWYPGELGGQAIADVILGDANPAGRIPITFPLNEGQLPLVYNHRPTGRGDDYVDGTGQPLFPFGYGLSYTTFAYSGLTVEPVVIGAASHATVRCRVKNTGTRAGDEVVQLYLHDELATVSRPVMSLAGFARVHLEPGEEREVMFKVGPRQLRLLDQRMRWVVEPGDFRVMVGSSSRDIRLRGVLTVR